MEAGRHPVEITINGKKKIVSKIQAMTMQLANKAASGDQAAMNKFLDWVDDIETGAASARPAQFPISEPDLEVLRAAYERMRQCESGVQSGQKDADKLKDDAKDPPGSEDTEEDNPEN